MSNFCAKGNLAAREWYAALIGYDSYLHDIFD